MAVKHAHNKRITDFKYGDFIELCVRKIKKVGIVL